MRHKKRSCIVIGAGLSGLAAAWKLTAAGWKVTLLESQDRAGGRVMSYSFKKDWPEAGDLVCELGGEWIGRQHWKMRRLCREFGLTLTPHRFGTMFWPDASKDRGRVYAPGKWPFSKEARRGFKRLRSQFQSYENGKDRQALQALDQNDWWSVLERNGFSEADLLRRDLMDSTDSGESIRLTSAYVAGGEYLDDQSGTDAMDFKIVDGNDRLPKEMHQWLDRRQEVRLGARVRKVRSSETGVRVTVAGRKTPFQADFCICTIPAHALLKVKWSPKLRDKQLNAARQLQYSRIMKTVVLHGRRFWERGRKGTEKFGFAVCTTRVSDFCFDSTYGQPGKMGILCSYSIGDKADNLASEPNKDLLARWITEDVVCALDAAYGPAKPDGTAVIAPLAINRQPWQREEGIGGAYAFYRPGQWFPVRHALAQTHDHRIFFAGEHLSGEFQGFMEGAVETGYRAAKEVMQASGRRSGRRSAHLSSR